MRRDSIRPDFREKQEFEGNTTGRSVNSTLVTRSGIDRKGRKKIYGLEEKDSMLRALQGEVVTYNFSLSKPRTFTPKDGVESLLYETHTAK